MSRYEVWYTDPLGNRIAYIPNISRLDYVLVAGDVGVARLSTSRRGLPHEANNPDYRLAVYRQPYGGASRLEVVAFTDLFSYSTSQDGLSQFDLGASDLNHLLKRRIVAYRSGETKADYSSNYVSNSIRNVAARNLGGASDDTARSIQAYGFSSANATSQGTSIDKQAAWKNCLSLLQDMQAFSKNDGTEIFFGIVPTSETTMEFTTWPNQPGSDRTLSSGVNSMVFSLERGNLLNPSLTYDYSNEANYIYAGGKGQQDQRNVQEASDDTSIGLSPYARKEKFVSAISGVLDNSDDQVMAKAKDALIKNRARVNLSGTIISTRTAAYGKDWFFGDKVTVDYAGKQFDTVIRAVSVSVDADGFETIAARVEISNE